MSVNPKYLKGLSIKEKIDKKKNIKETKKLFEQGKKDEAAKLAKKRPTTKQTKQSTFTQQIKKKYPDIKPNTKSNLDKKEISFFEKNKLILFIIGGVFLFLLLIALIK